MGRKNGLFKRDGDSVHNSSEWGCYVTDSPYIPVALSPKNITSQSWFDENGDDEFIPETIYYKPVEITLSFVYKGTVTEAKTQILSFVDYLRGGFFSFYDEYSKVGRQNVRLMDFSSDAQLKYDDVTKGTRVALFSVELKINDPVTDITL